MTAAEPPPAETPPPKRPFRIEEALGAAAMGMICLISISNVVVRYATDVSFAFTEEFSVFLLMVLTFVGASLAFARDDHIRITFLTLRMGRWGRRLCNALSMTATIVLFGVLAWYGGWLAWEEYDWGETSPALGVPTWIYTIWLPVLCLAVLARVLGGAWADHRARRRGTGERPR